MELELNEEEAAVVGEALECLISHPATDDDSRAIAIDLSHFLLALNWLLHGMFIFTRSLEELVITLHNQYAWPWYRTLCLRDLLGELLPPIW